MTTIKYKYNFRFPDGIEQEFKLHIDSETLELVAENEQIPAEWMQLEYNKCTNCSLNSNNLYCPLALHLGDLISFSNALISFNQVQVEVILPERTIINNTTVQQAVSSIMGLIIPCSGCPHTAFLKPLARFHLPFASVDETTFRATSMFLLAQLIRKTEGHKPDFSLAGLKYLYKKLHVVNSDFSVRLRNSTKEDASINALVLLDLSTINIPYIIEHSLKDLQHLFTSYLK